MLVHLTKCQRERLQQLARDATEPRLLKRATALLDLAEGHTPESVARKHQVTLSTIYNWVKRYRTRGVSYAALRDLPRPGRPRGARPAIGGNGRRHDG